MPRWLLASFIAFVLSCYGFAAAAQAGPAPQLAGDGHVAAAAVDDMALLDGLQFHDADDDLVADLDEGSDLTEFLTGVRPLLVPAVAAVWPPRHLPATAPLPPLERLKRPPRSPFLFV